MRCARLTTVLCACLAIFAACGGEQTSPEQAPQPTPQETAAQEEAAPRGGTLRVGVVQWSELTLDPQADYTSTGWELLRCCLARTLLSYNGTPTAEGGADLRPDLAAELPEVSADGLTWTFRLEPGRRYAPPYEETEIVAADLVGAVERTLRPAPASVAEATGSPWR
jgi:ABC-type transport system substrate-binding protein